VSIVFRFSEPFQSWISHCIMKRSQTVDSEKQKEEIFVAAIEIEDRAEREAYLAGACGEDDELLSAVVKLLKYHDANSFLDSPALEQSDVTGVSVRISETVGSVIGRYKLLEKIGEGGMAVVYMAEQERPIRRKVALKIIKLGMDTKQVIGRFDLERQALAMMDHPNIAKVLDAGATEGGRPYFVMELVKGVSITEYCDTNKLSTRERLDLFIAVCHAVQHAHQKGIIHRDIKPANVMVTLHDGKAVPKVIDFGIAKATKQRLTEKTLFTRYAQMIGTPAYMSPEQAEMSDLGVDTRTDIYSLGVLLYELLTGATPFSAEELRKGGYLEIQRIIRKEEPPKPSTKLSTLGETLTDIAEYRKTNPDTLQKQISGDLDWIVMKTLEKDRARRYETVNELGMDVNRHLASEPVLAAAPSVTYRLRKFIRRNRVGVMVGCLVAFVVVVAVSALSVSTVMIWREKGRTEAQADRAEANLSLALEALDEIYLGVAKERLPQKVEIEETDRELLQKALIFYERFAEQNRTVVEARYEMTKAHRRVGDIHYRLGEYEQAIEAYLSARQAFEKLVEEFPQAPDYRKELVGSNRWLGRCYWNLGRSEEAEQALRRAFNLAEKLVAEFGDVPAYRMVLADSHQESGRVLWAKGQFDGAEQVYRRALPIWEELTREFPNVPEYRSGLAGCYHMLELMLLDQGKLDESEQACHSVLALWEELVREFPDVPSYRSNMAMTYNNLGVTLERKGELDEAEQAYRSATAIQEELVRDYPSMPRSRSRLAFFHHNMGDMLTAKGELDESEQAYRSAIAIYEELGREFPNVPEYRSTMAASHQNMGDMLAAKGELDKAERAYRSAIAIKEELGREFPNVPEYRATLAGITHNMGDMLTAKGELDKSEQAFRSAIAIKEELAQEFPNMPEYRSSLAASHQNMGDTLTAKGELDEAEQTYGSASAILKELAAEYPEVSDYQMRLGASYFNLSWYFVTCVDPQLRDAGRAVELARKGVEAVPEHSDVRLTLGIAHYRTGDWQATVENMNKSIQLQKDGGDSRQLFFLAMAHWQLGEKDEAGQLYNRAVEWMEKNQPDNDELRRFRAEAAELLGISEQPDGKEVSPLKE
jgi:tetratricopeptide (TPR) repeat protein